MIFTDPCVPVPSDAVSLVNYSDMARDIGMSPNTVKSWTNVLALSGIITPLEPWFANMSKRLAKTPKLYFNDQGLLCRLLNIADFGQIDGISPVRNLFFYRDQNKVEVDFLIENGKGLVCLQDS